MFILGLMRLSEWRCVDKEFIADKASNFDLPKKNPGNSLKRVDTYPLLWAISRKAKTSFIGIFKIKLALQLSTYFTFNILIKTGWMSDGQNKF